MPHTPAPVTGSTPRKLFVLLLGLVLTLGLPVLTAPAASAATSQTLCDGRTAGEWSCAVGSYSATSRSWADRYYYAGIHNCTRYVAHRLAEAGVANPGRSWGNAYEWDSRAPGRKDGTPAVGSVAQWERGSYASAGHVAVVEEVGADYIVTTDDSYGGVTGRHRIARGSAQWPSRFIHIADQPAAASAPSSAANPRATVDVVSSPATGQVRVRGWAWDPDAPSTPVAVHVYVGGTAGARGARGYSIPATDPRADVNRAFGTTGGHGFDATVGSDRTGDVPVCLYAINVGAGATTALGCRTVSVAARVAAAAPPPGPLGVVDRVGAASPGAVQVTGWAFDRTQTSRSTAVHVYVGGPAGTRGATGYSIPADRPRADVARVFGITGDHGFGRTLPAPSGRTPVCLYAIAVGGSNTPLGCTTVTVG